MVNFNIDMNNISKNLSISVTTEYAAMGNMQGLTQWLNTGNNPNAYDEQCWTPLLKASVRGHTDCVQLLLENKPFPADANMPHGISKALPIHFAGHSGSVPTAKLLLDKHPGHLNKVWHINGHTILLQAVFYGHLDLVKFLLQRGADSSITTARGLGPMELAKQFQNTAIMDIIRPYDCDQEQKASYYNKFLAEIAPEVPHGEKDEQELTDQLHKIIEKGLARTVDNPGTAKVTFESVKKLVEEKNLNVNRLGGPLQQPALIVVVTGNNGFPTNRALEKLRFDLASYLLDKGADPMVHEVHPMGAQTIIRACVFNHLDILRLCAKFMSKEQLTLAINEIPVVNGLTALHDTVLRATMADAEHFEKYLDQARWCMDNGGRSDIEDFSGRTQTDIAENAANKEYSKRLMEVLLKH
jgi:ankyrin repeat protein